MVQLIIFDLVKLLSPPRCARRAALFAACLATALTQSPPARGAGSGPSAVDAGVQAAAIGAPTAEYLLKAAFLYNFASLTRWPGSAFAGEAAPLRLCVLGDNPFGLALPALDGRLVQDRPLETRQIPDIAGTKGCHLLYIGGASPTASAGLLNVPGAAPLLVVGERPGHARQGIMINLRKIDDRIMFEINLADARGTGLTFDPRLLQSADRVYFSTTHLNAE